MHGTVKPHYRPEDVYAGTLLGRLEALHSGVTTMLDWYHVARSHDHEDAAVAALRDAPEFATVDAAQSCGLDARTGSLTPRKDADVILLRADDLTVFPVTDPVATIVGAGHPGLVDTVLVAGRVVKRDGVLVSLDLAALRTHLVASRNRIAAAAGIPINGTWRPRPESK
ncbi:amidohydrolase family protein [Streptomyces avermitilis]|uniref:amidohydrolase family protein n=1 Tax=Streptomyces avermitilis TaxID=33903 RepID=UPI0033D50AC4